MKLIFTAIVFALGFAMTNTSFAQGYEYTYAGQSFQSNTLPGSTDISVDFFSQTALAPNTNYGLSSGIFANLIMSDGVDTIPVGGGSFLGSSFVGTNGVGAITSWTIVELQGAGRSFVVGQCCTVNDPPVMMTYNFSGTTDASIQTNGFFNVGGAGYAYNNLEAGTWTVAAVPEPATYGMFLLGLGLIAFTRRRT